MLAIPRCPKLHAVVFTACVFYTGVFYIWGKNRYRHRKWTQEVDTGSVHRKWTLEVCVDNLLSEPRCCVVVRYSLVVQLAKIPAPPHVIEGYSGWLRQPEYPKDKNAARESPTDIEGRLFRAA